MSKDRLAEYEAMLEVKLEDKDAETIASLGKSCAIDSLDHASYQGAQSSAFVSGRITEDDAQIAYTSLGEVYNESNGGWAQGTTIARKIAVTQMVAELIGAV